MRKCLIIILFGCFSSCSHKTISSGIDGGYISPSMPQVVKVDIMGNTYNKLETVLRPVNYVKLSSMPLLGHIKRVFILNERIYVWDVIAGIVCYDMSGNLLYQMNSKGQGPKEYVEINAFTVNTRLRELVIYDNAKQTLMFYSADNGKFIRSERLNKPAPTEMIYFSDLFYYHNRLHRNYQKDVALHYYLLSSKDATHIEQRYFEHHENEEQYAFSPSRHNLYYNYKKLYYCRDFDNIVYQIYEDSVVPCFKIELPQPMPYSKIEEKPNELSLMHSGYSLGISDVYENDGLLYFRFVKDGYILSCLYNISKKEQICCDKRLKFSDSSFFDTIDGVYKDCFYSILTPEFIDYALSENSKDSPDIFKTYNVSEDNPVIAFYKSVEEKKS